ncbi:MAG: CHAT domain-containing protein, partial [Alloprevotella sp.]|nr:CHAT domain-containing protein [Alloprevotella sp.]
GLLGEAHTDYAQSVNNLAKYNYFLGNYGEAVRLGTEALHLREKYKGRKHPDYATALSNLADYHHRLGRLDEALRLGREALKARQDVLGRKHPDYALSLANMAEYYSSAGKFREAAKYAADALKVREAVLGTDHPDYINSLKVLALLHYRNGNMRECERLALMASERYTHTILKTFAELTAEERNYFWKKTRAWLTQDIYLLAHASPTPALVREAYDCTLLGKGLLLNCEIEMKRLLLESGDGEAVARYQELQDLKRLIWQQYERAIDERTFDTDSLVRVAHDLERALVLRSKAYGDYTKNLQTDWQAVAGALGEGELAVEFVTSRAETGQTLSAALLLRRGMPAPKYVPHFTGQELAGIANSDCYMTPALAELVWKPMADELEGVEDIFFSPQGELHNMAIESLPNWQTDSLMSARWRFHRLSSTRELTNRRGPSRIEEAVIYGGMVYDLPGDKPFARGISYLPATRTEVEGIDSLLAAQHIATHIYTRTEGTEAGLKQRFGTGVHGRRSGILHIATHGFYWTPREAARLDRNIRFLSLQERRRVSEEDKSLTRSGLFLSGANRALAGKTDGDGADDGVLTAKEIAALDFRSLDLVVLSACETALGEVKGDGVFGLQRGFKRAGAQSLLMSLWKVDDEATRLLMVKFYEKLAEGMGKADALRAAQAFVRDYEVEVESEPQHKRKL